ncbi:hypothetical protein BDN71DRAFT_1506731 [Pleurotus eryngii]|uniref:Ribonuclease H1 N-terminal domain-containing protein n=1 Tax=Pleurotus eryngii TaxID=5323 RepID=A0A9P5ZWQ1_PLEER|nr:hypothetical protein BDN71DRAFT_1506731 [Pleurotus eryngii]
MQTTLADLLEMLLQLDLSTVVDVPPSVSVLVAGLNAVMSALAQAATPATMSSLAQAATPAMMSALAQAATPTVTSALAVAATTTGATDLPMPTTVFFAVFRCPGCDSVHFMGPVNPTVAPVPASSDAPPPPGTPAQMTPCLAAPSMPSAESTMSSSCGCGSFISPPGSPSGNTIASSSSASTNSCWYSVTYGQQIGVFHDWYGVVEPLVNGVPGWKCKSFSTLAVVTTHFNACAAASIIGVHVD